MTGKISAELRERAAGIRLLVLDVDGVLTDGRLHYDAEGREFKSFHVRDGYGIRQVMAAGITVAVISGRASRSTAGRMAELGVRHVLLGRDDKAVAFDELLGALALPASCAACIGDDEPDLPVMRRVALPIAVADCHPSVSTVAAWHTTLPGGAGAVREVCDLLLASRSQG
ncbi:MAG: phenylphosphate carboxylase subunit delta [Gammaproteobacteria bacterium]|nr:phenylphosphate carboxylase subunit delta [Gammaproteobacteria bacterium]